MYLSQTVGKPVFALRTTKTGKNTKQIGICRGVGYSLKSGSVSYLLCSDEDEREFFISVSLLCERSGLVFSKARRLALPNGIHRFTLGKPVYRSTGEYLGVVAELSVDDSFKATVFETDNGAEYACSSLVGLSDALIVGKRPPFPVERTLKSDLLTPSASFGKGSLVTRALLRSAIKTGNLIRLTTSFFPLSPSR